ncbi:RbsD/FucU family protein [Actinopolymorpha pittospori]|uniref:L-fucose mutarotase n=1 Tax=Actinopolymorpha pittospori TaxID=648752 RepID=A0A927N9H3_9ACTN|nr:RbsD/FucU family protein [Actinopolymorpha pittospori]MBE1611442.1 L-fucose mutarotase [Actinopolymorpha pittospori]
MLRYTLIHPEILAALASAGHGSRVLIADGHYPFVTAAGPNATHVFLNLTPGRLSATEVLTAIVDAAPIESASVMQPPPELATPEIFAEFENLLPAGTPVERLGRFAFYEAAKTDDVALVIATGEQRTYANILLTLGVAA